MSGRDKYFICTPYSSLWLVREEVESVVTDNVHRITVTFTTGDTRIMKYDSTADMLDELQEIKEWMEE